MARIHRKLFPSETTTNQTLNCYGFCDPSCPSNCYTNPDYYFFSPPPPPPQQSNHISSYLIIILSLFTIIFLVIAFYVIKVKCYADWCGRRVNNSVPSQTDNNSEEEFHPVWLISTVGLQQSIINSITVCKYKRNEGLIEGTECSVCLNEFREDDTLRLLPKCSHAFHIACIDTWLRSHTNCPLCRAGIVVNVVSNNNNSGNTHEADVSNLGSLEQQDANLGRNQDTLLENEDGLRLTNINNMVGVNNGELENRVGTGESSDAEALVDFSTDESNSKERVLNDPIQNHGVLLGGSGHHHVVDHRGDETELDNVNLLKQDGGDYSKPCKTKRRSSIEECLHISPVIMKRSFSWNGRIVSTRGYMNLNSTLPY